MDNHTPEQRRKNMQAVKNKDSKIELLLRKALWNNGIRYRKNVKTMVVSRVMRKFNCRLRPNEVSRQ